MSKTKGLLLAVAAAAMAFTFSCSGDDGGGGGGDSSSSGDGSNLQSYGYCIFSKDEMCLEGPFTLSDCNSIGGIPSNNCPYGGVVPGSSGGGATSSSSVETGNKPSSSGVTPSSPSVVPSSGSVVPSSSGGEATSSSSVETGNEPSSPSVVPSSGSVVPSSSSALPSSSSVAPSSSSAVLSSSSLVQSSSSSAPPSSSSSSQAPSSSSPAPSSSSLIPSSSSQLPSSSSQAPSSSSTAPSSSSVGGLCAGFVKGTKRLHYEKEKEQFCDERDGKKYVYVVIGTQTWMAENLNYNVTGSKCYGNVSANCNKYGRLYNWAMAMNSAPSSTAVPSGVRGVCPSGWHLPSKAEWEVMTPSYISSNGHNRVISLIATSGWKNRNDGSSGNGTDDYGFSALPGGNGFSDGSFDEVETFGGWWSSASEDYSRNAYCWFYYVYDVGSTNWGNCNKTGLISVRCLQD